MCCSLFIIILGVIKKWTGGCSWPMSDRLDTLPLTFWHPIIILSSVHHILITPLIDTPWNQGRAFQSKHLPSPSFFPLYYTIALFSSSSSNSKFSSSSVSKLLSLNNAVGQVHTRAAAFATHTKRHIHTPHIKISLKASWGSRGGSSAVWSSYHPPT